MSGVEHVAGSALGCPVRGRRPEPPNGRRQKPVFNATALVRSLVHSGHGQEKGIIVFEDKCFDERRLEVDTPGIDGPCRSSRRR